MKLPKPEACQSASGGGKSEPRVHIIDWL